MKEHRHGLSRAIAVRRSDAFHSSLIFIAHLACLDSVVLRIKVPIFRETPRIET